MLERTSPYPTFSCCVHVVSSYGKKLIILRCRVAYGCNAKVLEVQMFLLFGVSTLDMWMTIITYK